MKTNDIDTCRRQFMMTVLSGGALGLTGLPGLARAVYAMGAFSYPQGMQKVQGDVKINGITAQVGSQVAPGDVVTTGPASLAIFVVNKSVYLVRDNTRVDLSSETSEEFKEKVVNVLRMARGKMLSVFGRGKRNIVTPTAVAGIRGSGVYVEVETERTYICTCYGIADIEAKAAPGLKETVKTRYHDAPRYVYGGRSKQLIVKAPVKNHTDAELIMLEELVWRKPPFAEEEGGGGY